MKLWLVRHARPAVQDGLCYGASDVEPDHETTVLAARKLARALPAEIRLRSSPLRRCAALAHELRRVRPDVEVVFDSRLKELDFGAWELMKWRDIPRTQLDHWAQHFSTFRVGGAESVQALLDRVARALAEDWGIWATNGDAAWITHAGVIRAAQYFAQHGLRQPQARDWPLRAIPFGSWEVLTVATISPSVGYPDQAPPAGVGK
jgi:alpha-ribazole phosphatase